MTNPTNHTELPWKKTAGTGIMPEAFRVVIATVPHDGDRDFIVTACNAHYALLTALKGLRQWTNRIETPVSPKLRNELSADIDAADEIISQLN